MQKYEIVKLFHGYAIRKHFWYSFIPGFEETCFFDKNEDRTWSLFIEEHCIFRNINAAERYIKNKRKKEKSLFRTLITKHIKIV